MDAKEKAMLNGDDNGSKLDEISDINEEIEDDDVDYSSPRAILHRYIFNECYKYSEIPFKLAAGGESHHYFDLRKLLYDSNMIELLVAWTQNTMEQLIWAPHNTNIIGGGFGAAPLVFGLCSADHRLQPVLVRQEEKTHGTKGKLVFSQLQKYGVLVDDVLTSGKSMLETANAAKENGIILIAGFVILDREEGGMARVEKELEIPIFRLFSVEEFV